MRRTLVPPAHAAPLAAALAGLALCGCSRTEAPPPAARAAAAPAAVAEPAAAAAAAADSAAAAAPAAAAATAALARPLAAAPNQPTRALVATLPWGSGPQALGKNEPSEANPTAPMAIAPDRHGRLWILDQDNERVVRLDPRAAGGPALDLRLPVALRWPQDLALLEDDTGVQAVLLLDRLAEAAVVALDPTTGAERWRLTLRGDDAPAFDPEANAGPTGLVFGGGVTGLFLHDGGVWVEWAHERCVRIGSVDGSARGAGQSLPGRPGPGMDLGLRAQRTGEPTDAPHDGRDEGGVLVTGYTLAASGAEALPPSFAAEARFAMPVFALRALLQDADGNVWVAANLLRETADGDVLAEQLEVVRFGPDGRETFRDTAALEQGPHEQLRTFAVGPDGTLWHLARRADGAVIERWTR